LHQPLTLTFEKTFGIGLRIQKLQFFSEAVRLSRQVDIKPDIIPALRLQQKPPCSLGFDPDNDTIQV